MAVGQGVIPRSQANHIEINLGNIFTIGLLSVLFTGGADWTSNYLARKNIPVLSSLAVGAHYFLHAA
jgi:hypothetical protein